MFRTNNNFDKLLDKATSNLRLDPDWPSILQICDLIRQNDCNPKYAVTAIKKKITSQNPHQAMFALLVLESIVKNCGSGVHEEVASVTNCESFRSLVKSTEHENVRSKLLELMQTWAYAFRNITKYRTIQDAVNILKAEGYKFPQLKESDAMFSADSAPEWADGDVCNRCRVPFSLVQRKHHCRACGQVFCQQCSAKTATLPKFGIEKEVRVCDACLEQVTKPPSAGAAVKAETDSPTVYVANTQESQAPPRKTAEELQEEEEFQLALALSQSEAEQKEKEKQRIAPAAHVVPAVTQHHQSHGSPPSSAPPAELSRYLDRNYWEQRVQPSSLQLDPPSAPTPSPGPAPNPIISDPIINKIASLKLENGGASDPEMEEFITTLKSQVEIFVNRMKSNSSRGRSIANDSSVQTLFMNITTMHSRLLRYIQLQDDNRVHYEKLQDKLTQVKDSRAALDVLREEHAERLRRAAEQAELQRQLQMAHKLDVMRKKKQEYLQYQRQLALQRVQEQEREMQMRQEQQKHQYMLGGTGPFFMQGSPVHQYHSAPPPPAFNQGYPSMMPGLHQTSQMVSEAHNMIRQPTPQGAQPTQMPQQNLSMQQPGHMSHIPPMNMQMSPMSQSQQGQQINPMSQMSQMPPGMPPPGTMIRPGMNMNQLPHMNMPNQHGNQNSPQGPQLPHQSQLNKPPQMNMQNPQVMQGSQSMQQPQHMGPQGPQINPALGPMQQIPPHGQPMPPHQMPQMGQQQTPINQTGPQVNQQNSQMNQQVVGQHQMHSKGMPIMYMDPQMNQQMGQMPQMMQMGHQGPHMGQIPPQLSNMNQNMAPGHQPQQMGMINNQMPPSQMVNQQISQGMNQNQVPHNNQPVGVPPVMDQKTVNSQIGNLSPTGTGPVNGINNQGSPVPAPLNQNPVSPPKQQHVPPVEENSTAELISFD